MVDFSQMVFCIIAPIEKSYLADQCFSMQGPELSKTIDVFIHSVAWIAPSHIMKNTIKEECSWLFKIDLSMSYNQNVWCP